MKDNQKHAYVQDNRGIPLSPTKEEKAWYMVRHGKATLLGVNPTVIQLNREQDNTDTSSLSIGIDPGDTTGIAIVQECKNDYNNKVIFKANINHRNDIKKKMEQRRSYRRFHRYNKRHRKARFNNRSNSKRTDRVAPSIRNRKDEILRVVTFLLKYVRIDNICCEDVAFDIRALTEGYKPFNWQYSQSNRLDENIRKAVIMRDNCCCQLCGASNTVLEVHHITPKRQNGEDTVKNLITLCSRCHSSVTGNEDAYKSLFYSKTNGKHIGLRYAQHTMIGKKYLYEKLGQLVDTPVQLCTGCDTANRRIDWGIEKSHTNDAVCITGIRCLVENTRGYNYEIKPQRKKSQAVYSDDKLSIKHRDIVWYHPRGKQRVKCYVTAILQSGRFVGYYKLKTVDSGRRIGPVSINSITLIGTGARNLIFI